VKRYWTRSDFETDFISRDYPMRRGKFEWKTPGEFWPEGARDTGARSAHSGLVTLPAAKRQRLSGTKNSVKSAAGRTSSNSNKSKYSGLIAKEKE
jgi:hypothetical protein